jgi:iron complex outermembrane receptor protein
MGESKAFNTLSLNGAYKLTKNVEWSIGVDNLLDETYAEHLNKGGAATGFYPSNTQYNNIGRNYWTRISMKF